MNAIFYILIVIVLATSCNKTHTNYDKEELVICEQMRKSNNQRLAREGIYSYGDGFTYDKTITSIDGCYYTTAYKFTSVKEAMSFASTFFTEYLKPFNEENKILSSLQNFPLTSKNLQVSINFLDENAHPLETPYISCIDLTRGKLTISTYDKNTSKYSDIHKEPFELPLHCCRS